MWPYASSQGSYTSLGKGDDLYWPIEFDPENVRETVGGDPPPQPPGTMGFGNLQLQQKNTTEERVYGDEGDDKIWASWDFGSDSKLIKGGRGDDSLYGPFKST